MKKGEELFTGPTEIDGMDIDFFIDDEEGETTQQFSTIEDPSTAQQRTASEVGERREEIGRRLESLLKKN